jgi:UDP-N-acetyl-D-glucosamine dehydrogenase
MTAADPIASNPHAAALAAAIDDRTAVIAVMGLGYVGLPLAAAFHGAGFRVLGFDFDAALVARINGI